MATTGALARRCSGDGGAQAPHQPPRHRSEQDHAQQFARGDHEVVHDRRLPVDHHERVGRAVGVAERPRGVSRIGVDEERRARVEHDDESGDRAEEHRGRPRSQAALREREHQVDQQREDQPGGDAPDAVGKAVGRCPERGERPGEAGADEEQPEASLVRELDEVEADGDGHTDDRRLHDGAIDLVAVGVPADEDAGQDRGGPGHEAQEPPQRGPTGALRAERRERHRRAP